jgi:hypothetical protein
MILAFVQDGRSNLQASASMDAHCKNNNFIKVDATQQSQSNISTQRK